MNIYVYINILVLIRTLYYILVITLYSGCRLLDRTDSLFFIILSKSYLLYNYIIIYSISDTDSVSDTVSRNSTSDSHSDNHKMTQ